MHVILAKYVHTNLGICVNIRSIFVVAPRLVVSLTKAAVVFFIVDVSRDSIVVKRLSRLQRV